MKWLNFLSLVFLLLLVVVVFQNWLVGHITSAGDSWYYFSSMYNNHFLYPYSWYTYSITTGLGGPGLAFANTYMFVAFILDMAKVFHSSWENVSRVFMYLAFIGISLTTSVLLVKKVFPKNPLWVFAPLIFIFNTYVLMLTGGGQIITALSYSLMPLSLYLLIRLVEVREKSDDLIVFSISLFFALFFQCVLDLRIAFVTTILLFVYLLVVFLNRELRLKNTLFIFLTFILTALSSAYWLVPILFLGINPLAQLGTSYTSTDIVKFLSFAKLENSISLMHPYWPENVFGKIGFMKPEFLILPILVFSSLLFVKKDENKKFVLFFALVSLLGIFLGKGASEPFGNLYIWMFSHVPGLQLFRDSFKWYTLIAISFSMLVPFSIHEIYKFASSKETKFTKSKVLNLSNLFVVITIVYLLFLIRPGLFGQLGGTFVKRNVPIEYQELNNYLSSDQSYYRTLWVPNTMLFGYYSNTHPEISGRDFFRQYDNKKLIQALGKDSSRQALERSSVKYVIVPQDSENEIYLTDRKYDDSKYQAVASGIDGIPWLNKEKVFGKVIVYSTPSYRDHFWCDCNASISYKFINPTKYIVNIENANEGDKLIFAETFDPAWVAKNGEKIIDSERFGNNFNSFNLHEGNSILEVSYSIQKYVDLALLISVGTIGVSTIVLLVILAKKARK